LIALTDISQCLTACFYTFFILYYMYDFSIKWNKCSVEHY